ncbi:hypothetical protein Q4503_14415 [Colwellia sp. 6_MG-2023]|uniref:hypothetical protein n=1 Tax=Colwellia sp. 6_MG-2023 TaxID=3062676 RepID=UPI0026E2BF23|nr:hypothetical protein [Colwellia sp. 6_MG-2023]MDO6488897.1 hypothetical protein [Colwellia sp. 6_MG-2023]
MSKTTPENISLGKSALFMYSIYSLVFAVVILVFVILPAEYNIDPTGIGKKLGLTVFNEENTEISTSLSSPETAKKLEDSTETTTVIVPAGRGVEYKFTMEQYQKLTYEWTTDGTSLYFDLHGEPTGDTSGYFESYAIATAHNMKGSFTTPFAGSHGWYWKNTTNSPITVKLTVKGEYTKHGLK